jgi:hypothetical protein
LTGRSVIRDPVSGYREKETMWRIVYPDDRWRLSYIAAQLGFGLLAISLGILVTGGALIIAGAAGVIGAALLAYGFRNY